MLGERGSIVGGELELTHPGAPANARRRVRQTAVPAASARRIEPATRHRPLVAPRG